MMNFILMITYSRQGTVVDEQSNDERDRQGRHLYRRAIHIPASIEATYEASVVISVVITFNLPLTHHLMATSESTNGASSNDIL
jgi:hypothetical protein